MRVLLLLYILASRNKASVIFVSLKLPPKHTGLGICERQYFPLSNLVAHYNSSSSIFPTNIG